jgi:hypothetical protein
MSIKHLLTAVVVAALGATFGDPAAADETRLA